MCGSQVTGDLTNATIAGSKVNGAVASATNAATADDNRGAFSAAGDANIASPAAGQLYFNMTPNVFRQYDGTVWKTIDAGLGGQLSSVGTLNAPTNLVDWTQLKNVPASAASGYTAGTGISISPSDAISSTGVLSVSASAPLTTSGGQNPTISLDGTVPVANGGTGLSSAGAAGRFLRSNGSVWTSAPLAAADVPAGSANYIQNSAGQQAGANFNISGSGTAGGMLSASVINAGTQFTIGGDRVVSVAGTNNLFVGIGTGHANTTGFQNTFLGASAGSANTTGENNSFFGHSAGYQNRTGSNNVIIVNISGYFNTSEDNNTYLGAATHGVPGITNATAIGRAAEVGQSNSVVLSNTFSNIMVGIGTSTPSQRLEVVGSIKLTGGVGGRRRARSVWCIQPGGR